LLAAVGSRVLLADAPYADDEEKTYMSFRENLGRGMAALALAGGTALAAGAVIPANAATPACGRGRLE
jgi:hypothetical protein